MLISSAHIIQSFIRYPRVYTVTKYLRTYVHIFYLIFLAPTAAPTNLMVESHTPYISTLTWSAPHTDHQNGKITYYNIQLTEEGMSPILIMAPSLSYHLSPLKAHTSYTVTVAAVTSVGSGPSATVTFMTPQDGEFIEFDTIVR